MKIDVNQTTTSLICMSHLLTLENGAAVDVFRDFEVNLEKLHEEIESDMGCREELLLFSQEMYSLVTASTVIQSSPWELFLDLYICLHIKPI